MADETDSIGLATVLEDLRMELVSAQAEAAGTSVQFPIERLTVELKVAVTRTKEGRAGFRVPYVGVELRGSTGIDHETLQTITVVLGAPVDASGNPVKVISTSDQRKG